MAEQLLPLRHVLRAADADGTPLAGGSVTYVSSGTTTPVTVYSDPDGTVPMANPVTADSTGTVAPSWFAGTGAIDAIVKDSAGATVQTLPAIPRFAETGDAAASVSFVPAGSIAATNVQAALEDLDTRLATEVEGPRSIATGGTGGTTVAEALDGLQVYGIGRESRLASDISVTDNSIVPGLYRYDTAAGSSGGQVGVTLGHLIHMRRAAGGGEAQMMIVENTTNEAASGPFGSLLTRVRSTGSWTSWRFANTPEEDNTANGHYIRSANGTLICGHTLSTSAGADVTWTFPSAFSNPPNVTVALIYSGAGVRLAYVTGRTTAAATIAAYDGAGARVALQASVIAVGRWD